MGNGNDDISSEEHFENSKTRRGTYLLLELLIFVQILDFYLVIHSLFSYFALPGGGEDGEEEEQ